MAPTTTEPDDHFRAWCADWFARGLIRMHVPIELACFWASGILSKRRPRRVRQPSRIYLGQQSPRGTERPPVITTRQQTPPPTHLITGTPCTPPPPDRGCCGPGRKAARSLVLLVSGPYDGQHLALSITEHGRDQYSLRTLGVMVDQGPLAEYRNYNQQGPDAAGQYRFHYHPEAGEQVQP